MSEGFEYLGTRKLNLSGFTNLTEEVEESTIQKSHISSAFGYSENVKMKVSGKKIKEGLEKKKQKYETKVQVIEDQMEKVLSDLKGLECEAIPNSPFYDYDGDEEDSEMTYSWEIRDKWRVQQPQEMVSNNTILQTEEKTSEKTLFPYGEVYTKMGEYNELVHKKCRERKDLKIIAAMLENIEEKKQYELTPKQLIAISE